MEQRKPYHEDEELKKEAPLLSSLGKKQLFTVPENYFDDFHERMMNRVREEKAESFSLMAWFRRVTFREYIALASFCVLLFFSILITKMTDVDPNPQYAAASAEELIEVMSVHDIDDAMIADVFSDELMDAEIPDQEFSTDELQHFADEIDMYDLNENWNY